MSLHDLFTAIVNYPLTPEGVIGSIGVFAWALMALVFVAFVGAVLCDLAKKLTQ